MKTKLFAILLALALLFCLAAPAMADTKTTTTETTQVTDDGTVVTTTLTVTVTTPDHNEYAETPAETTEPEATEPAPAEDAEPTKETDEDLLAAAAATEGKIVILYTNDVHCGVEDNIGYVGLAKLKKALENAGNHVLLVDNGDALQGGTIGTLSKGAYIIDIMNAIGYDVATIGNHEFDYGVEQLLANVERANFPYVSANFTDAEGNPIFDAYKILEVGGKKIAFVGLTTPRTFVSSTPVYFQNENGEYIYTFSEDETGEKLYTVTQNAVDAARADGADYVIAMTHLGIEADCSPWTSSEVINNTTGIDVCLDAHAHAVIPGETVKNKDGEDVLLTSTGTKLAYVGVLTIDEDGTFHTMLIDESAVAYAELIGALSDDGGIGEVVDSINAEFAELINQVVAHSDVDLITQDPANEDVRIIRNQETNLGDLCADAYRSISGAQIAFVNGGGIRKSIPAGDITYGQIISVHPFGNMMCVAEVSGSTILDALEMAVAKLPGESGGFQHVSGMRFTIDLNVDSTVEINNRGEFIGVTGDRRIKNVTVLNGETGEYEPLDPEKTYTLASHNYLLEEAGDGFTMFKGCTLLQDKVMIDNQVLITYIVEKLGGNVGKEYAEPFGEGRITIVEKGEALPAAEPEAEAAEPEATEPEATEPEATEPKATEPEATEPEATEPEATDAEPAENADAVSKTDEKPLERVYGRWHCDLCNSNFYSSPEIEDNQYVCRICGKTGGLHQIDAKGNPIVTANEDEEAASEVKDAVADEAEEVEKEAAETEAGDAIADAVEGAAASTEAAEPEAAEDTAEPETAEPAADAEASAEAPAILLGGWALNKEDTVYVLPEAAQTAFDKALAENEEFTAKPIALLGQQVVAGMNYAVLAEVTPLIEGGDIVSTLQVLIIYADLQGNATLTDVLPFDLGTLSEGEYAALPDPTLAGGWAVPEEFEAATLPEDVQAAFDKALVGYTGLKQEPVAYLGSQVVAGTNYAILCHSSLLTAAPVHSLQIVFVNADLEGNASITNITTLTVPGLMELAAAAQAPVEAE